jgi:DNA polymerase-4/protein ImuB
MRLLCVLLPHFPWQCEVRRNPDLAGQPALVVQSRDTAGSPKLVFDWAPELDDLQPGMPLQSALARHGQAVLLPADVPFYRTAFNEILDALENISPLVEEADLGGAYISIDGLHLIYPEDKDITAAVRAAVPEAFVPRMGIAGNKFLAYLAARRSPPGGHQVFSGDTATLIKDLPCTVLPVSLKSLDKLREFGLNTLGQITALPPGPFQSQFGPEGKRIWELAGGSDATPLYPRMMEVTREETATLPSVTVSLEAILFTVETLLRRVFTSLASKGLGVRSLDLWTRTWNAENWERTIRFKEPAMDLKNALARVKRVLEDYPQPGPVEQLGMSITRLGYPRGRQRSLFSDMRAKEHLAEDIKQLESRLGTPQVYKVKEVEPWSRIPERRYALAPTSR